MFYSRIARKIRAVTLGSSEVMPALKSSSNIDAIFVWIPKTAGSSLFRALEEQGCVKLKKLEHVRKADPRSGLVTFGHINVQELVEKRYLDREYYLKAKKFTFVRDPYDRALSLYYYIREKRPEGRRNPEILQTFESFLDHLVNGLHSKNGLYNAQDFSQCRPQIDWTNGIEFDFVGRFEEYEHELTRLVQKIGLRPLMVYQENASTRSDRVSDLSLEAKQMIEEIYSEDFSAFGYTFRK
ncbi:sulfotransferase family 2 domain-containing protein [Rhodobacteraceae bacterium 2376]|uniref:Sulfotransferase family 2 domain-containing protein n=1 Tax=Rhabdonatronobacter sediminivivens TaxID=2743469 RepID=A0A7Z0I271_9RHOB|nr:sulfotransferase family 2 domain-containing protein [Rhabdonatronobacter sediminivivens]NYS26566.1 sulfotransferase family 2 domain-containing protein [Rhabdonatronobacter sediminivivens]